MDHQPWDSLFWRNPQFGTEVASHVTMCHSLNYEGGKSHPSQDAAFNKVILFPEVEEVAPQADPTKAEQTSAMLDEGEL
jgi:hypothetical protein